MLWPMSIHGRGGALRRAGVVARWPVGMATASWRYLWRTTPVYREERTGPSIEIPALAPTVVDERLLRPRDGTGPCFHRSYAIQICAAKMEAQQLVQRIAANPNWVAPSEIALFRKTRGEPDDMDVNDEYLIRMPGPWDGPVRVVDRTATSFRFATLQGHLEAGQIEFRAGDRDGHLTFRIESWARSGDAFSARLYDRWYLAKEMQLYMWTHFLRRIARVTRGQLIGGVHVDTERSEAFHDAD